MGIKIATITYLTYIDIQSHYLIPAILTTWNKELLKLKKELGSEALRLGGVLGAALLATLPSMADIHSWTKVVHLS